MVNARQQQINNLRKAQEGSDWDTFDSFFDKVEKNSGRIIRFGIAIWIIGAILSLALTGVLIWAIIAIVHAVA